MGGNKRDQQATTTTSTATGLPAAQSPYLQFGREEARRLYDQPVQFFPGSTVAPFAPEQEEALQGIATRARAGSPLLGTSQRLTQDTLEGKFLNPASNPYLGQFYQRALDESVPQLQTSAIQAGRFGGGIPALMQGRLMADLASNIYGRAYETERERQQAAIPLAPQLANQDFTNLATLASVGEERRNLNQENIDEAIRRFEFGQLAPHEKLGLFLQEAGQPTGGETTSRVTALAPRPRIGGFK